MGSEPLFDSVITPQALTAQVINAKQNLSDIGVQVTVSEMAYGYQVRSSLGSQAVLDAVDSINAHILPFFAAGATTGVYLHRSDGWLPTRDDSPILSGANAWSNVLTDLRYFIDNGGGKKIYLDEVRHLSVFPPLFHKFDRPLIRFQNAWPSASGFGNIHPQSATAVASVSNEKDYFALLDQRCESFKAVFRSVGWFFHIYSDVQEPGYGLYTQSGVAKFPFSPRTHC
jgi:hypothetical protein